MRKFDIYGVSLNLSKQHNLETRVTISYMWFNSFKVKEFSEKGKSHIGSVSR